MAKPVGILVVVDSVAVVVQIVHVGNSVIVVVLVDCK